MDAALAEDVDVGETNEGTGDKENQVPDTLNVDEDETLDLESFGVKKKKKKKKFNLDELDAALPDLKKVVSKISFFCALLFNIE